MAVTNGDLIPKDYTMTDDEVELFFVFCQLNRVMPYDKVCHVFNMFTQILWRYELKSTMDMYNQDYIAMHLRQWGHRFPQQTAGFMKANSWVTAHWLRTASRTEIVEKCKGFGMKLASLFVARVQGVTDIAIVDVHIKRYLTETLGLDLKGMNYEDMEKAFVDKCHDLGVDPVEFDFQIWESYRLRRKDANETK